MIYDYFPQRIRSAVQKACNNNKYIEEIRVRCGQNIIICDNHDRWFLDTNGNLTKSVNSTIILYKNDLKEMFGLITHNSVYAMQQDIKNGFITLPDGSRVGLCGRCVIKNGKIENINNISSFNIRLSRQVKDWGSDIFRKLDICTKNVLIVAPPGYGKTTLLRNMVKFVSDNGKNVSVLDERCEISPMYDGEMICDLGVNTDVLSDVPKKEGIAMLLRTMNPDFIATDEIMTKEDFELVTYLTNSGVNVFATFHGKDVNDYISKTKLFGIDGNIFDCFIIISKTDVGRDINIAFREEI